MMKKILFCFFCLLGVGLAAQNLPYKDASNPHYWKNRKPFEGYWQQDIAYKIQAKLDDSTNIVSGAEELTYTNNSPDTLYEVYFHLYQNAFVKGSYLEKLNKANDFKQKFGRYEEDGLGTSISSFEAEVNGIKLNETNLPDELQAKYDSLAWVPYKKQKVNNQEFLTMDNTIMRVVLPAPLLPGKEAVFRINFKTYFDDGGNQRRRMKMFKDKWGNKQYDGVHWYPRICVYDRKFGWSTDQHLGKEFYGDFGSYEVALTFPSHYVLDATGVLQNKEEVMPADLRMKLDIKNFKDKELDTEPSVITKPDGTFKTWNFKSINTHDFAWVADPTFRIGESLVKLSNGSEVSCISLAQEPHAAKWQDAAPFTAKVIETYSRDIGNYVYPKMIVADARDGMEYPMLTLDGGLSPGYYGLFAHEVGHNWFFGMVGNNETYRASLDEGFTQFLTNWCMTSIFGEIKPTSKNPNPTARMDQTVYLGYLRDAIKHQDMPLNTHSDDFNGALNHGGGYGHVYYKTATMLYNLQYVLGNELFIAAMQHYFDQWKMAHPYFEDFRNSIIQYTHTDLNWFFDQWMETTKTIDYSIESVHKTGKLYFDSEIIRDKNGNYIGVRPTSDNYENIYEITFKRKGEMQMPIDFTVYTDDSAKMYNFIIPNTYFFKSSDSNTILLNTWKGWGNLNEKYTAKFTIPKDYKIKNIKIDPTYRLADIYQPDNEYVFNPVIVFDKGRRLPLNRKSYVLEHRPDIWYNSIDGVKLGYHLEGGYFNHNNLFRASVWYNSELLKNYEGSADNTINYTLWHKNPIGNKIYSVIDLRNLDGLRLLKVGFNVETNPGLIEVYYKMFDRIGSRDLDYLLYPDQWKLSLLNATINIDFTSNYTYANGSGELKEGIRSTFFSDYDYSRLFVQWINHHKWSGLEFHSRAYLHFMAGTNIAAESQLFLSGSNEEDMMENKFLRSRAFVPVNWLGYGNNTNHFQASGGLNIRGYAGYLIPRNVDNVQVYMYKGQNGGVVNFELDLDGLVRFKPRYLANVLHLDIYLFGDAGIMSNDFKTGEYGLTRNMTVSTDLMACGGGGFAFTIKKWGQMDKAKPLTIRMDFPLLLNSSPFEDGQYFRYRWQVGLNRSF